MIRVLSSGKNEDFHTALLEDLPRLLRDAPESAVSIILQEARFYPESLLKVLKQMPEETKGLVISIWRKTIHMVTMMIIFSRL